MPKWMAVPFLGLCLAWTMAAQEPASRTLVTGWYPWDPYNYADTTHGVRRLTGLDVELTRAALAEVGIQLELVEMDWQQQVAAIEGGRMDLGMGTLPWDSRAPGVRYSKPYRRGVDVLFVDAGMTVLKGKLYAEIAIAWGLVLSAFFYWEAARVEPREIVLAVTLCTVGAFVTRMLAMTRRWRAPMF